MRYFFVLSLILYSLFTSDSTVFAHELIPKALQVYVQNNPNATAQELEKFISLQNPEFAKKYKNGKEIIQLIQNQNTSLFDNMYDFFKIGVNHILSGPDHILFVLSILLVFISFTSTLKYTATFTVAHSITLILAGTGLLTLSSRVVEPFIAFSIAYMAISTVFFKKIIFIGQNKAKIGAIFFFGLFHGLGFAGLLTELSIPKDKFISSLVAFNLGIEVGQLVIVFATLPFIYFFRKKMWYPIAIKVIALIISLIAFFWFLQRLLF